MPKRKKKPLTKEEHSQRTSKGTKQAYLPRKKENLKKLEDAFKKGMNITQATIRAGISIQTFYNYQKEFPEYFDFLEKLQSNWNYLKSKAIVSEKIEQGDYKTAIRYLENAKNSEFNNKGTQQNNFYQQNNYYQDKSEEELRQELARIEQKLGNSNITEVQKIENPDSIDT